MGKILFFSGLVVMIIGGFIWLAGDKLKWLGNLPGDIKIERENFSFYFPVTTMILVSIALTLIVKAYYYFK